MHQQHNIIVLDYTAQLPQKRPGFILPIPPSADKAPSCKHKRLLDIWAR